MRTICVTDSLLYNTSMGKYWEQSQEAKQKIREAKLLQYKDNSKIVRCLNCNIEYKIPLSRYSNGRGRYCSKDCQYTDKRGVRYSKHRQARRIEPFVERQ